MTENTATTETKPEASSEDLFAALISPQSATKVDPVAEARKRDLSTIESSLSGFAAWAKDVTAGGTDEAAKLRAAKALASAKTAILKAYRSTPDEYILDELNKKAQEPGDVDDSDLVATLPEEGAIIGDNEYGEPARQLSAETVDETPELSIDDSDATPFG